MPKLAEWNRTLDPKARFEAVMSASDLFSVPSVK
jgi:hypothetical protein